MATVKALQEHVNELVAHDLVAAIAGNAEAHVLANATRQDLDPK
jgi:uncharacterized cupin superfamily protein